MLPDLRYLNLSSDSQDCYPLIGVEFLDELHDDFVLNGDDNFDYDDESLLEKPVYLTLLDLNKNNNNKLVLKLKN